MFKTARKVINSANKMTRKKSGKGKPDGSNKEGSLPSSKDGNPKTEGQDDDGAVPSISVLPKPPVVSPDDQTFKNTEAANRKPAAKPTPTIAAIPPLAGNIPVKPSIVPSKAQRGPFNSPFGALGDQEGRVPTSQSGVPITTDESGPGPSMTSQEENAGSVPSESVDDPWASATSGGQVAIDSHSHNPSENQSSNADDGNNSANQSGHYDEYIWEYLRQKGHTDPTQVIPYTKDDTDGAKGHTLGLPPHQDVDSAERIVRANPKELPQIPYYERSKTMRPEEDFVQGRDHPGVNAPPQYKEALSRIRNVLFL